MNEKDSYIQHLENTIKKLENHVSNLNEMVLLLRKEKFGPFSEKTTVQIEWQLSLFNEAELEADSKVKETIFFRKGCAVNRIKKTNREELLKEIPVQRFPVWYILMICTVSNAVRHLKRLALLKYVANFNIFRRRLKLFDTHSSLVSVLCVSTRNILLYKKL